MTLSSDPKLLRPRAILFDLDDTLINTYRHMDPHVLWGEVIEDHAPVLHGINPHELLAAVRRSADVIWAQLANKKGPWMTMGEVRQRIVRTAFNGLGIGEHEHADGLAAEFTRRREESFSLSEGALETLSHLRDGGVRLALVTNGASKSQRWKIDRFELENYFDHIQIQEEAGVGKPEPEAYHKALAALESDPDGTWMVGDNYEWEVVAPKKLGIFAIWFNPDRAQAPAAADHAPDLEIGGLSQIVDLFELSDKSQ